MTVLISPSGKGNFKTYYKYRIDALAGSATITERHEYDASSDPTTATQPDNTTTTTAPVGDGGDDTVNE